jgi:hypothetical protein
MIKNSILNVCVTTSILLGGFSFMVFKNHEKKSIPSIVNSDKSNVLLSSIATNDSSIKELRVAHQLEKSISNPSEETRPDILFFLADDMMSIACEPYGNMDVHTPNLSKLAKEGMCFDNMNNATAMCGPTRQSLYTGIFPVKNGSYPNQAQV